MNWLALDIGGANIKAADGQGFAISEPFPLWQRPRHLAEMLRTVIAGSPKPDHLVATMTGELADCFATKTEGVKYILEALNLAADGRHTRVYLINGAIVAPPVALRQPLLAAATNWHALSRFAGRYAPQGAALLIDIGSTTCDIIPLVDGKPAAQGTTDTERLVHGELVYTGVERSPLCAIVKSVPFRDGECPVAQEVFATAWDAYLMLSDVGEEPTSAHTADRRPATKAAARDRLARAVCADRETFTMRDAMAAAQAVATAQLSQVAVAANKVISRMPSPPATIIISGQGEFLARRVAEALKHSGAIVSLNKELGPAISRCATAHGLAVLVDQVNSP